MALDGDLVLYRPNRIFLLSGEYFEMLILRKFFLIPSENYSTAPYLTD